MNPFKFINNFFKEKVKKTTDVIVKDSYLSAVSVGSTIDISEIFNFMPDNFIKENNLAMETIHTKQKIIYTSRVSCGDIISYCVGTDKGFFELSYHEDSIDTCRYFQLDDKKFPTSTDPNSDNSYHFWINEYNGIIGSPSIKYPTDNYEFKRLWVPNTNEHQKYFTLEHTMLKSMSNRKLIHNCMLYRREIKNSFSINYEYFLPSYTIDGENHSIELYLGFDINPASIKFI